jgi:hypothetical protein
MTCGDIVRSWRGNLQREAMSESAAIDRLTLCLEDVPCETGVSEISWNE